MYVCIDTPFGRRQQFNTGTNIYYNISICVKGTINTPMLVYKVTHFLMQKIFGQNTLIFARSVCYQWSLAQ